MYKQGRDSTDRLRQQISVPYLVKFDEQTRDILRNDAFGMLRHVALVRATRCNIQEDAILHSHRCENLKSYKRYIFLIILKTFSYKNKNCAIYRT
jgi:hypothetical protein